MTAECRDPWHISEDRPECSCVQDAEYDAYIESQRVRICLPCQAGDHRACDPVFCDCVHAIEPSVSPPTGGDALDGPATDAGQIRPSRATPPSTHTTHTGVTS